MMILLLIILASSNLEAMYTKLTPLQERIISNDVIIPYIFTDLAYVYQYPMDHVRLRYQEDYGANESESRVIEFEFKSFMLKKHLGHPIPQDLHRKQIEDFWHISILHTKDYYSFCIKCFGKMIHHVPTPFENLNLEEGRRNRQRSYSSPSTIRNSGDGIDDNHQ